MGATYRTENGLRAIESRGEAGPALVISDESQANINGGNFLFRYAGNDRTPANLIANNARVDASRIAGVGAVNIGVGSNAIVTGTNQGASYGFAPGASNSTVTTGTGIDNINLSYGTSNIRVIGDGSDSISFEEIPLGVAVRVRITDSSVSFSTTTPYGTPFMTAIGPRTIYSVAPNGEFVPDLSVDEIRRQLVRQDPSLASLPYVEVDVLREDRTLSVGTPGFFENRRVAAATPN
ncbi:MAG: hypothetical protein ACOYJ2_08275 [Rickettsiales bacterium]